MSGEKKMLWVKVSCLIGVFILYGYAYILSSMQELGLCYTENNMRKCIFEYNSYVDPIYFSSLFLFSILLFSFFISSKAFKKWLKFTIVWLIFETIWIINVPVTSHYDFDFGPVTKELAAVWFGSLFVIISLVMFVVLTIKEKRK